MFLMTDDDILSLEAAEVLSSLIVSKSSIQLKQKALITLVHSAAVFKNHVGSYCFVFSLKNVYLRISKHNMFLLMNCVRFFSCAIWFIS